MRPPPPRKPFANKIRQPGNAWQAEQENGQAFAQGCPGKYLGAQRAHARPEAAKEAADSLRGALNGATVLGGFGRFIHVEEQAREMRTLRLAGATAGAVIGGVSAATIYGTFSKSSQLFGPSVYRGHGRRRSIALTFDDGPSEKTPELLDYLESEGVKATFFQCGANVHRYPGIAGQVAAEGHEIGNHTYSHPRLPFKSKEFIDREFTETQRIIQAETGVVPMVLRPPYGFRWAGMRPVQQKLSLLAVMWTVIGYDWRWPAAQIARRVIGRADPGGIICLHDARGIEPKPDITETIRAVREIVPVLKDKGYSFEVVTDLLR